MLAAKLYVSATDRTGAFTGRGMVSLAKALETFKAFAESGESGKAVFRVLSNHDGRIALYHAPEGFKGEIVARAQRPALLGGLFPARDAVIWAANQVDIDDARLLITALYRFPASEFRAQVMREMGP